MDQEIRNLLVEFNSRQHQGETLNPDVWCKRIVVLLKQEIPKDAEPVDMKYVLAQLKSQAVSESEKQNIGQFLSFWLEHKCLTLASDLKSLFNILAEYQQRADAIQALTKIVDKLKRLKIETRRSCKFYEMITPCLDKEQKIENDNEKFEKILQQDCGSELEKFKRNCNKICQNISDIEVGKLMVEIEELSRILSPVVISEKLRNVLTATKLMPYLFCKITVSKLIEITDTDTSLQLVEHSAWNMLRGLVACNYNVRNEAGIPQAESIPTTSEVKSLKERLSMRKAVSGLHPMDILYASFLCCDEEAKQFLCQRLFACKLAFPFLYVNEMNQLVQSDWILKDINLTYEDVNGDPVKIHLCGDSALPVVSFLRTAGDMKTSKAKSTSKSKLINHLQHSEYHDTFFNKESRNGSFQRDCANGLVEAAVCLPRKNSRKPAFLALNLRGDIGQYKEQTDKLLRMSHCCVMFLSENELGTENVLERIQNILELVSSLIVVVCAKDINDSVLTHCNHLESFGCHVVPGDRSEEEISMEILPMLWSILSNSENMNAPSTLPHPELDIAFYSEPLKKAMDLFNSIASKTERHKDVLFRLQGDHWSEISKLERALTKTTQSWSNRKLQQIRDLREAQIQSYCDEFSIKVFINILSGFKSITEQRLFLQELEFLLEDHTSKIASEHIKEYKTLKLQEESQLKISEGHQQIAKSNSLELREKIKNATKQLEMCTLNISVIFREVALVYEAYSHVNPYSMPEDIRNLPLLFASLLISGIPLELLDGFVGNIPMKWISAVLTHCQQLTGDKKLFAVSVLGTQSTGKSTLLNTMFGLRLPVSEGRCTRGAFLQLVHVDENSGLPFDYLAVIDTEGLRAIERGSGTDQYHHDNKLATFVICLADLTIITVPGEDSPEMRNVLEIVINAMIKMKRVDKKLDLRRRCLFVHQNVSDSSSARSKLSMEVSTRQSVLDEIARVAAEKEHISDVRCFSDVIRFSPETDTFLMPGLWYGDPPTAPVNIGFSNKVLELKKHIITLSKKYKMKKLTFSDFLLRLNDTWKAVLTEDFVFNFRNSIEMKAARILDEEFSQIRSSFKDIVEDYLVATIFPQIQRLCKGDDEQKASNELRGELQNRIDSNFRAAMSNLKKIFEESEYRMYIVQWETGKLRSLEYFKEELIQETTGQLDEWLKLRIQHINHDVFIEAIRNKLMTEAERLTKNQKENPIKEEDLRSKFDELLRSELSKVPVEQDNFCEKNFASKLEKCLVAIFRQRENRISSEINALLRTKKCDLPLEICEIRKLSDISDATDNQLFQTGTLSHEAKTTSGNVLHSLHLSGIANAAKNLANTLHSTKAKVSSAEQVLEGVKFILFSVESLLSKLKMDRQSQDRTFRKSDAIQVVNLVCDQLDELSERLNKNDIELLIQLKTDVAFCACRMALKTFGDMDVKFREEHSLKTKLDKEKSSMCTAFIHRALKLNSKNFATIEVKKLLEAVLVEQIKTNARFKLKGKCVESLTFKNSKLCLIVMILQQIVDTDNVDLAFEYVCDPKAAAIKFITSEVNKVLFHLSSSNEGSFYFQTIKASFLDPVLAALEKALEKAQSPEAIADKFCELSTIPLSKDNILNIFRRAKLENSSDLSDLLRSGVKQAVNEVKKIIDDGVQQEEKPGVQPLCQNILDDLWGCEHKCPLCSEPCIHMDAKHLDSKVPHRCTQHRPMGLTGAELKLENEFANYGCNYFATKISTILQGTKEIFGADKRFRCQRCEQRQPDCRVDGVVYHKCYKYNKYFHDWDIEPLYNAHVSDAWKRLAYICKERLVYDMSQIYKGIPDEWKQVSKEMAKSSLNENFQLQTSSKVDVFSAQDILIGGSKESCLVVSRREAQF